MAAWRKCDTCRKVLPSEAYDGDAATCISCLSTPEPTFRTPRASPVRTVRPAKAPVEPVERRPLLGVAGSGDLEVRERRARRVALDQLAETYPVDFEQLLQVARRGEGLCAANES